MEIDAKALEARYRQSSTEELLRIMKSGGLREEASKILSKELSGRDLSDVTIQTMAHDDTRPGRFALTRVQLERKFRKRQSPNSILRHIADGRHCYSEAGWHYLLELAKQAGIPDEKVVKIVREAEEKRRFNDSWLGALQQIGFVIIVLIVVFFIQAPLFSINQQLGVGFSVLFIGLAVYYMWKKRW